MVIVLGARKSIKLGKLGISSYHQFRFLGESCSDKNFIVKWLGLVSHITCQYYRLEWI